MQLAQAAEKAGSRGEALALYRRYRDEAPAVRARPRPRRPWRAWKDGSGSPDSRSRRRSLSRPRFSLATLYRRRSGSTFAEWLARDPAKAQEARPVVGRLRHEVLKHGGMLLSDAAERLAEGDPDGRRETARLLVARLYGESGARGLLAEADASLAQLTSLARESGERLNLRHRDPVFAWLLRGLGALRRARRSLRRLASDRPAPDRTAAVACRLLRRASQCFTLSSGSEIARTVERVAVLPVRADALRALLARVASESDAPAPELEAIGELVEEERLPGVRISALDWETIWRNLFGNAVEAGLRQGAAPVRLGLSAEKRRDPVTGEARLRLVLADDLPGEIDPAEIRARGAERGLGVVVELLRKSDGSIDVVPAPARGFTKGIAVDLPSVEDPA